MSGFSIFMFIFAICVLLVGFYMFTGHELKILSWRVSFKDISLSDWKNIGKWTMIVSIFIFIIAILGFLFNFE